MFDWLLNRRTKQAVELLSAVTAQLEESRQLNRQALAVCEKWARICDSQATQLTSALADNARLWTALGAPPALQGYIAAGFSQAEAEQVAKNAPRCA